MKTIGMLISLLVLTISGCNNEMNPILMNSTLDLNYKQTKALPENKGTISLDSVLNDSRCPIGAECVWAGNAEVRFIYSSNDRIKIFNLNTLFPFRTDTLINGYRIKLIRLDPYPQAGTPIQQNEYRAELKVTQENTK